MQHRNFCLLLLCLLPLLSRADTNSDLPPPYTAVYGIVAKGLPVGEATRRLIKQADGQWLFESVSITTGLAALIRDDRIEERSVFTLHNGQIRPMTYRFDHTGSHKQRHKHVTFDWQSGLAHDDADNPWEHPLEDGVLDDFVYQLALMQQLQQGKRDLILRIVDRGKIKTYRPQLMGEETIETDVGEFNTLKYRRSDKDGNRHTTFWCAPALHFLPVRIEHNEKGDLIRSELWQVDGLR